MHSTQLRIAGQCWRLVGEPYLAIIDGRRKAFRATLPEADYAKIRLLGAEYRSRNKPRSVI